MPETVPQTAAALKAYFQTGNIPTQDQFGEFVDTMYYLYQQVVDDANASAASAAAAQALINQNPIVSAYIQGAGTGSGVALQGTSKNVAGIAPTTGVTSPSGTLYRACVITFTNALANAFYRPAVSAIYNNPASVPDAGFLEPFVIAQTINSITVGYANKAGMDISLLIFPGT